MSYQKLVLVGNLGSDPDMQYLPGSGDAVTNFSLATNRQHTASSGERVTETTWFRITAWGRTAETCNEYLRKGSQVLIEGRLNPDKDTGTPRIWTRQDGTPGASYEVTAERVVFLGAKSDGGQGQAHEEEGDVPF